MSRNPIYSEFPLRPRRRQTRVVKLMPGNPKDEIKCGLESINLGERPNFEAISYAWGTSTERRVISFNDKPHLVSPNLEAASNASDTRTKSERFGRMLSA
jgi:hypothetical protein